MSIWKFMPFQRNISVKRNFSQFLEWFCSISKMGRCMGLQPDTGLSFPFQGILALPQRMTTRMWAGIKHLCGYLWARTPSAPLTVTMKTSWTWNDTLRLTFANERDEIWLQLKTVSTMVNMGQTDNHLLVNTSSVYNTPRRKTMYTCQRVFYMVYLFVTHHSCHRSSLLCKKISICDISY